MDEIDEELRQLCTQVNVDLCAEQNRMMESDLRKCRRLARKALDRLGCVRPVNLDADKRARYDEDVVNFLWILLLSEPVVLERLKEKTAELGRPLAPQECRDTAVNLLLRADRILPMSTDMAQVDGGGQHISEEDMDFYVRACPPGIVTAEGDPRIDAIEAHLFICAVCRNRLQELDDLRRALGRIDT